MIQFFGFTKKKLLAKIKIYLVLIPVLILFFLGGLNIYKKITWKEPTDGVFWDEKPEGLTMKIEHTFYIYPTVIADRYPARFF